MTAAVRCHYCGKRLEHTEQTRDHIVPRTYGGLDKPWNIVLSCQPCNAAKAHQWPQCTCTKCSVARRLFHSGRRRRA